MKIFMKELKSQFMGFPSVITEYSTSDGTLELREILGDQVFSFPKPSEFVAALVEQASTNGSIILDSFSGSGTTGHAVLKLNGADRADRKFILVEMDQNIAREITTRRLSRAITGYSFVGKDGNSVDVQGLGGGFRYCTLAEPLFDEAGNIRKTVSFNDLAAHVFFTETGAPIPKRANGRSAMLGVHCGKAVYLLFNGILGDKRPNGGNVLTSEVLKALPSHDGPKVIYGEGCRLGSARLKREGVVFKQVPYDITVS